MMMEQYLLMFLLKKVSSSKLLLKDFFLEKWILFIFRQVGLNLIVPGGVKTIDATGKLVMPGISCIFIYFS